MVDYINKVENLIKRLIDLSSKNKFMAYCSELPFGIFPCSSYRHLEKLKIVSPVLKENEYKKMKWLVL